MVLDVRGYEMRAVGGITWVYVVGCFPTMSEVDGVIERAHRRVGVVFSWKEEDYVAR